MQKIKRIIAKNLKGMTIDQAVGHRTVLLGPNGSGKSAHTEALQLALLGYVPGGDKTNAAILDAYGSDDTLWVGLQIDGDTIGRQFKRTKSGTVSQSFFKGKNRIKKEDFVRVLTEHNSPLVVDLTSFMALSDAKKVDEIFDLYPPADDIEALDEKITTLKEKINVRHANIRDNEKVIQRLSADKQKLELPGGSLPEVENDLQTVTEQVRDCQRHIAEEQARIAAEEKAEKEAKEKAQAPAEEKREPAKPAAPAATNPAEHYHTAATAIESVLGKIINTMDAAGCEHCVARMVAVRELKKIGGKI